MGEHATLFRILEVEPDATDDDVRDAWAVHLQRAGDYDSIPQDVRDAYRMLQDANRRSAYRELLEACRKGIPVPVPDGDFAAFRVLCNNAQVGIFPDPKIRDTYHIRLPGQPPPLSSPEARDPAQPTTFWRQLKRVFIFVVSFKAYRGTTLGQKLGYTVLYLIVICAGAYGARWSADWVEESKERRLERDIRSLHSAAVKELPALHGDAAEFTREFESVIGVQLDKAGDPATAKPRRIDLALIEHESVREAWAAIVNARISPERLREHQAVVDRIGSNVQRGSFLVGDRASLLELTRHLDRDRKALTIQSGDLDHIRVMLDAAEFGNSDD